MLNVQPPDESAGVVNDSVYTNAVASASMTFCLRAAQVLGVNVSAHWADIAAVRGPLRAAFCAASTHSPASRISGRTSPW